MQINRYGQLVLVDKKYKNDFVIAITITIALTIICIISVWACVKRNSLNDEPFEESIEIKKNVEYNPRASYMVGGHY